MLQYISSMVDIRVTNTLRLLQTADLLRARVAGEFSAVHGLSVNEFFLLMHLDGAPLNRLSRVELARRMHVSASTITRMAAPMEKLGLLSRKADKRDARLAFVVLAKAGKTRLADARTTFARHADSFFQDRWDQRELEQLAELLNRFVVGTPANLT